MSAAESTMPVVDRALLERYDKPGPRYTSYPTAPVWTEDFGARDYRERLHAAAAREGAPVSLYVHLPYCESLCWYCACSVVISKDPGKGARYVDDVLAEAALVRRELGEAQRPVVQHHWGGGTPTFLPPAECKRLFEGLAELFPLAEGAEVSIEVDPRVTTMEHLDVLAELGFARISLGVQDFDPRVQEAIHRVQSFEQTRALVEGARARGFASVNLDLVYGLPHQSSEGFGATLEAVDELRPDRIACYSYAHVPWLKKHQRVLPEDAMPSGAEKQALYVQAYEFFVAHGMEAIGMDHFARRDDELARAAREGSLHRNFMGYTTRVAEDMLSFGLTSIGEVDGAFTQNLKNMKEWQAAVRAGELPVQRGHVRDADDEARRRVILDLMCRFRLDFAEHERLFGGSFRERFAEELARLADMERDGLVRIDENGIEVSELGRLFVRNIGMAFDAHLRRGEKPSGPRFSRTV